MFGTVKCKRYGLEEVILFFFQTHASVNYVTFSYDKQQTIVFLLF